VKTLLKIVGAALIITFGIQGMRETVITGLVLEPGQAVLLEKIAIDSKSQGPSIIRTVETRVNDQGAAGTKMGRTGVQPVSLELISE
jgi:hypothetical protein